MSRVDSNYERKERDAYQSPPWVAEALVKAIPRQKRCFVWEPACGEGSIVKALADAEHHVHATDIVDGENFFDFRQEPHRDIDGIVTNPPYTDCSVFIDHALDLMHKLNGFVVLLLPVDYDSAKTRRALFADCPIFAKKIALTQRIVWFERSDGKPAAPSENHAIYVWDHRHMGRPGYGWAP